MCEELMKSTKMRDLYSKWCQNCFGGKTSDISDGHEYAYFIYRCIELSNKKAGPDYMMEEFPMNK